MCALRRWFGQGGPWNYSPVRGGLQAAVPCLSSLRNTLRSVVSESDMGTLPTLNENCSDLLIAMARPQ